ncbi:MAG: phytanoyl-CoA dioxygenase family protein [Armatimonas sp.]
MHGTFDATGILRLPGAFSLSDAQQMQTRLWEQLKAKYGIQSDDSNTWTVSQPTGFQSLTRSSAFAAFGSPDVLRAIDTVLGQNWQRPEQWGTPLITFPRPEDTAWSLPGRLWHLDFPARRNADNILPGLRAFAILAPVAPRNGATLVLEGSHRLIERLVDSGEAGEGHSSTIRQKLARKHPWLRTLWSDNDSPDRIPTYMDEGVVIDGIPLKVAELTGEAGEAILMHPWTFHTASPNCGTTPRMILNQSIFSI